MAYPDYFGTTTATSNGFWRWTINVVSTAATRVWRSLCTFATWIYDAIRPTAVWVTPNVTPARYRESKVLHLFQRNIHKEHGRFIFT